MRTEPRTRECENAADVPYNLIVTFRGTAEMVKAKAKSMFTERTSFTRRFSPLQK